MLMEHREYAVIEHEVAMRTCSTTGEIFYWKNMHNTSIFKTSVEFQALNCREVIRQLGNP